MESSQVQVQSGEGIENGVVKNERAGRRESLILGFEGAYIYMNNLFILNKKK